jgi:hypothetical protein
MRKEMLAADDFRLWAYHRLKPPRFRLKVGVGRAPAAVIESHQQDDNALQGDDGL